MELGEKLRSARLAAGLSQRQLCDGIVTRNMLSQIEHGTARPSMHTLQALAARLGRPMAHFLEESADPLAPARQAWRQGDLAGTLALVGEDATPEGQLLRNLALLGRGEQALAAGQRPYARQLLTRAGGGLYWPPELESRRLRLLAQAEPRQLASLAEKLPSLDADLLLRARAALEAKDYPRCAALLDAMEARDGAWCLLRGRAELGMENHRQALLWLHQGEKSEPREAAGLLEACYLALEDYKMAYFYARQKP